MRRGQRIVAAASIIIAAASIIAYVFYRIHTGAAPLWDKVLAAYGVVFCLFLWFDRAAKSVADARTARRSTEPVRPRPRPGNNSLQSAVLPSAEPVQAAVELERVQPNAENAFFAKVQAFVAELAALEGAMPAASENGMAVRTIPVEGHDAAGVHPFQICAGGRALGVCTVRMDTVGQSALLEVFYIDPEVRRKHLGKSAMQRLAAFLRLAGTTELQAVISVNNWRAARFVEACGFRAGEQATSSAGSTSWVLRL